MHRRIGLLNDDSAQGLLEYSLIIALIAMLMIGALRLIGQTANTDLNNAALHIAL